jgi:hypothetical protein
MHALLASAAAALLVLGGLALFSRNSTPPESARVAATASSGRAGDVAVQPRPGSEHSLRESLERSLAQDVADAQVIVVATALDSAPAPAKRPGDLPETLIRFRVKRVLKGELADQVITTQTPIAAGEFIGKDWIILLSPDYMAGKYQYASHVNVKLEQTVKASLPKDKK